MTTRAFNSVFQSIIFLSFGASYYVKIEFWTSSLYYLKSLQTFDERSRIVQGYRGTLKNVGSW